ncbi:MAG: hypothetical protein WAL52_09190 [Candidatus Sulfotelmatobacter sp.]
MESWLEVEPRSRFAGEILAVDGVVADRWGRLPADAKRKGTSLSAIDGLLAATALEHNLTIVCRELGQMLPVSDEQAPECGNA